MEQKVAIRDVVPWLSIMGVEIRTVDDLAFLGRENLSYIQQHWKEAKDAPYGASNEIAALTAPVSEQPIVVSDIVPQMGQVFPPELEDDKVGRTIDDLMSVIGKAINLADNKPLFVVFREDDYFKKGDEVCVFIPENAEIHSDRGGVFFPATGNVFAEGEVIRLADACRSIMVSVGCGWLWARIESPGIVKTEDFNYLRAKDNEAYRAIWETVAVRRRIVDRLFRK